MTKARKCYRIVSGLMGKHEAHTAHLWTATKTDGAGRYFVTYCCLGRDHYNV